MQNRSEARKGGQRENFVVRRKDAVSLNKFELEAARLRASKKAKACVCMLVHRQMESLPRILKANLVFVYYFLGN